MNINDKSKALTAEDIIRRYNLEGLKTDRKQIKLSQEKLEKTNVIIKNYINSVMKNIDTEKSQDKKVISWFLNGIPINDNMPTSLWVSDEDKNNNLGDLYYDKNSGISYKYSFIENSFIWQEIGDIDVIKSLALANSEADTSDGFRVLFYDTPVVPYSVGDIWLNDNVIMRCRCSRNEGEFNSPEWVTQDDYTEDMVLNETRALLNQFIETVENDYITSVQLEATKDSIFSKVESDTKANHYTKEQIDAMNSNTTLNVEELKQSVDTLTTSTSHSINVIEERLNNGVSQVKTETGFVFDKDGLKIDKEGAKTGSITDEAGTEIIDKTGSNETTLQYSGYVTEEKANKNEFLKSYEGQTINYSKNILFEQYLSTKHYRIEETYNSDGDYELDFFYLGGE